MKTLRMVLLYPYLYRILLCFILIAILGLTASRMVSAGSKEVNNTDSMELSFKSVKVSADDTLWKIAKENYSEGSGSLEEYIQEIMRCNSLTSENIDAGSSLIVPIYISSDLS